MRSSGNIVLLIVLVGGLGYLYYFQHDFVRGVVAQLKAKIAPCRVPTTYSIGTIDTRFGISTSTLIEALKGAETIWEKPSGKDLFAYAPGGDVKVNLVYDYRQEATDKMATYGIQIDRSKASYDSLKVQYENLAASVDAEKVQLAQRITTYERDERAYNAEVTKWNREGGAPPAEYERLQRQKAALTAELSNIRVLQATVNADIDKLNVLGTSLNKLIAQLNLNVARYNKAGAGAEFEEGLFESSAAGQRIDIFEYSDRSELVRVLAHELGHALGLGHVEDTDAIMYKINKPGHMNLARDDVKALDALCASGIF